MSVILHAQIGLADYSIDIGDGGESLPSSINVINHTIHLNPKTSATDFVRMLERCHVHEFPALPFAEPVLSVD